MTNESDQQEERWKSFVDGYRNRNSTEWSAWPDKDKLLAKVGNEDIAIAVYGVNGEDWKLWLNYRSNALDRKTPLECLKTAEGTALVKKTLMRMHT
jgi:uncharacterized protein (DUF2384 family)